MVSQNLGDRRVATKVGLVVSVEVLASEPEVIVEEAVVLRGRGMGWDTFISESTPQTSVQSLSVGCWDMLSSSIPGWFIWLSAEVLEER